MTKDTALPKKKGLRGFWSLVGAQFQAAFNDNAYENLLMTLAAFGVAGAVGSDANVSYVLIVFTLPFMFASPYGGQFADRFSKRTVTIGVKLGEIGIMIVGLCALFSHHLWVSLLVLGLMGIRAGVFGPSKYGIIPELVPEKKLSWANGVIELTTFIAIMGGTIVGIELFRLFQGRLPLAMAPLIVLSLIGAWIALGITRVPAAAPDRRLRINAFGQLWKYGKYAHADRVLWLAVLGNTFFWFAGAMAYQNVVVYAKNILLVTEANVEHLTYLRLGIMLGIGLGSYLAGVMSGGKIEYGLVPLGAIMMALPAAYLYLPGVSLWGAVVALTILGLGGGFFIVPVQALVQHRPEPAHKGGVQGVAYFLTNASSLLAGFVYLGFTLIGFNAAQIFFIMAFITLAVTVYLVWLLPDSLLRLVLWVLGHTFYRIRVVGRDNIPERGGALFVSNHMSLADAVFVTASTDRHVRFIMHSDYYDHWFIRPFARMMRAIPIAAEKGPRVVIGALRTASRAIRDGDVVCIFPEGQITRTGQMLPFRRGFERIMKGVDAPIVPIHLDRVWGSIFSFKKGRFFWKWPEKVPYPITVSYGAHMPAQSRVVDIRRSVQELGTEAFATRRSTMMCLHREFVRHARLHPGRFAMADGQNDRVTYRQALVRSIALARLLRRAWRGENMVGILMPPSVSGACVNIAALLGGKIPVNLNYTASAASIESAVRQCGLAFVVTSRAFLDKVKIALPCPPVFLEDVAIGITTGERLGAVLAASLMPAVLLERWLCGAFPKASLDDTTTVIFSSGSTGDPKGVVLTHYNVLANVEGIAQVLTVEPRDRILGVLPFFHSFGFTGTLWFPLLRGFGVVYHPNPMDGRTIGQLVARYGVTLMVATPTFLQNYIRRVEPGLFGSLRYVLVGAEKLPERVAAAFEDQFGIRPMEAYGTTECAPAVTINVPGFRAAGFFQVGGKRARIGHPLPGVTARVVDPDTFEPLGPGEQGMLLVKGPNLMSGYLGQPDKTSEVMHDGWYVTGDIAAMDEDGFLVVTDRLSRFSKIGGEMVPHVRVEETLHELAGATQQCFAVTSVPDDRKGERLVVLHTLAEEALKPVLEKLTSCGLPNLWAPRPDAFFRVDALPVLGTGKMDLRAIRQKALELAGSV